VASDRLGVCTKTLERWEAEGKIKAYRTQGGQRRYDIDSVTVPLLLKAGMTIEDIAQQLNVSIEFVQIAAIENT
jgi:excisionase family DNA binding protein